MTEEVGISRRRLLELGGVAGVIVGGLGGAAVTAVADRGRTVAGALELVPFWGAHQAGIATPAQDRLLFASFDITSSSRDELVGLLREWTVAGAALAAGQPVGGAAPNGQAPPPDTGEAVGLGPARLTITFGFGPTMFTADGVDRFGLAARRPAPLVDLPAFKRDSLDPARSGGDLCIQACGDDPQVLFHAIRNLTRIGRGVVRLRWVQEGFGRTSSTTAEQSTARNLMGFKDGTNNVRAGAANFDEIVWASEHDDPPWMAGGSYLVTRRIRIRIEIWDRSSLADQEATIGRTRAAGAPLGKAEEFAAIDLGATGPDGAKVIPLDAHVRLANQSANDIHLLRRGYNFTDGIDDRVGQLDAGLFFIAFQRDPRTQFVPLQSKLAQDDALNEYISHVSSATFAVPPGVSEGQWIGSGLFD